MINSEVIAGQHSSIACATYVLFAAWCRISEHRPLPTVHVIILLIFILRSNPNEWIESSSCIPMPRMCTCSSKNDSCTTILSAPGQNTEGITGLEHRRQYSLCRRCASDLLTLAIILNPLTNTSHMIVRYAPFLSIRGRVCLEARQKYFAVGRNFKLRRFHGCSSGIAFEVKAKGIRVRTRSLRRTHTSSQFSSSCQSCLRYRASCVLFLGQRRFLAN